MIKQLLVCLSALLMLSCSGEKQSLPSLGTLEVDRIALTTDSNEPITNIRVTEGDLVKAGDEILQQDADRGKAVLQSASAALAGAQARLDQALAGPRLQEITAATAQLSAAESEVKTIQLELDREKLLVQQNYGSKNTLDILNGRFETAVSRKEQAAAILEELKIGTRAEEIDAARSAFAGAKAQVSLAQISYDRTRLIAPVDGIVESVLVEVGERPQPGRTVIVIVKQQTPYARVYVPEILRARLTVGHPAEIRVDGFDKPFVGALRWIAHDSSYTPYFALTQKDRTHLSFLAEVVLNSPDPKLPTGIPVEVYFPGIHD